MERPTAFITDGRERIALAVTRSLGRRGIRVTVAEQYRANAAGLSCFCARRVVLPSPTSQPVAWLEALLAELQRRPYDVFLPIDDVSVLLAARHADEITRHTRLPFAPCDTLMQARDKGRCLRIAEQIGVPVPRTWQPSALEELEDLARQIEAFPVVIKPRESSGSRGIRYVRRAGELAAEYRAVHESGHPLPLVQEYIPPGGAAIGVSALISAQGEPRAVFAHRRIREYPPSGGPSTLRESCHAPEAADLALRLLQALKWYGVAMVEFRVDPRDRVPKLMEVNPRLWGSLALAIASGVDFPYLLYQLATEGDVEAVKEYRLGVQCRWLWPGDLLWFLWHLRRGRFPLEFLRFWGLHDDVLSIGDPLPALGAFSDLLFLWRTGQLRSKLR